MCPSNPRGENILEEMRDEKVSQERRKEKGQVAQD
jgi:hypothetical protein